MSVRRLTAVVVLLIAGSPAGADDTPAEFKPLEKMAVKLLEAYNKDDAKGAFADFIPEIQNGDTTQFFNLLFKPHKETCGKYKKHTFRKDGSVHTGEVALMILDAEFEKKKAKVMMNFFKQDGKWRIQGALIEPK